MHRKLKHFILLTALVAASSLALAEDPPARVARVSVVEGQVTVQDPGSDEAGGNLVNWPVTSGTRVTAAPGARTEFRVGSTAVRLDGDSSMEVIELDDNVLRLRLDYGTASVRLRNPEQAAGFELETPQGRVTMAEPGLVRVDAERMPDTTVVNMLAGSGRIDGAGTSMNLRSGKLVEVRGDDVRTGLAQRTSFDDWVQSRDRRDENSPSLRYVTADVTGYEELDANGTWRDDPDYGPLWAPRAVPLDWAPYRDGRWTWLDPWGWTWVDDAPWGYAPSHYGRWVFVQSRWYWAPGRRTEVRPVWAPALVGWVGGNNWNVTFRDHRAGPGVGWYPLTPRDQYVPNYRVSVETQRRLEWQHAGRVQWRERDPRTEVRRDGVTVLPREYFERRSIVNVGREPRVTLAPNDVRRAPLVTAPPAAPVQVNRPGRVIETRRDDWRDRRNDGQRPVAGQPQNVMPGQPQRFMPGQQGLVQQPGAVQEDRRRFERQGDERGRLGQPPAGQLQQPQQVQQLQPGAPGTLVRNPQQDAARQAQEQQRQEQFRQERQRQDQLRQDQLRQDQQRQDQQRQMQQRDEQQRQEQFRQERQRQDQLRQDQQRQTLQAQQAQQEQQRQAQQRQAQQAQQAQQEQQRQAQQREEQQRQAQQAQQREAQQREIQQRQEQQRQEQQRQMQQEQQRQMQEQQRQQAQQRDEQQRREQREAMRQERQLPPQGQPQQGPRPQQQPAEHRQQRDEREKDGRRKAQE